MDTEEFQIRDVKQDIIRAASSDHNAAAVKIDAIFDSSFGGEPEHLGRTYIRKCAKLLILIIESDIFFRLILRDKLLAPYILFHCVMPVQMIRSDIQYR